MKSIQTIFILLFMCSFTTSINAQYSDAGLIKQVNAAILYPGVSAELPLRENISISGKLGLAFGFAGTTSSNGQSQFNYIVSPAFNLQGRFYYNGLKETTKKGKSLFGNSGNYGFFQVAGNLAPIATNSSIAENGTSYSVGVGWGLQRLYGNNFIVSWGIGLGYHTIGQINAIGELTLGINLYKEE